MNVALNYNEIYKRLPTEINEKFLDVIEVTIGTMKPQEFMITLGHFYILTTIFNGKLPYLSNTFYPVLETRNTNGQICQFMYRRALIHLHQYENDCVKNKGFTVETHDGNPLNLTTANLKQVSTKKSPRRNDYLAGYITNIRLKAWIEGRCPEQEIADKISSYRNKLEEYNDDSGEDSDV